MSLIAQLSSWVDTFINIKGYPYSIIFEIGKLEIRFKRIVEG